MQQQVLLYADLPCGRLPKMRRESSSLPLSRESEEARFHEARKKPETYHCDHTFWERVERYSLDRKITRFYAVVVVGV